jgi:DNA-binding NarL/FixJ family response regulator
VTRTLLEEFTKTHSSPRQHDGIDHLTDREEEVLRELARGLSNLEIAEALFVSETTVKTHVSHILTKLELRDRVQAVVVAYESGLVVPGDS